MKIVLNDILKGKSRIALGGHVRPDGDCVGSCMGLYLYLKDEYPQISTDVYLEEVPEAYRMIKGTDEVKSQIADGDIYDLFICLDCGDAQRLGFSGPLFENAKETVCIDHHISNEAFADHNYIVPDASSTSELVYTLLDDEKISKAAAEALYMGIAHDTGVFQYSCTSPETMETAANLMRKGINGSEIIDKTYYEKTYIQNQILGRALLESMLIMDKKCIVSVIRQKSMEFFQAEPSDLEGIVSQLRQTKGVEVAIFLHEISPHKFKVSLRSKGKVDVSEIAKYYGGGGHVRAAGVTMEGSSHDVINNITARIAIQLNHEEEQDEEK
ncbi:DHH family phosphoesterase [Lachnoclostridium sp. An298]|nr:DHH family phosphoesterase [Lachnoclostridium sp. An298]